MDAETVIYEDPNIKFTNKSVVTRTTTEDIASLSKLELKHKFSYAALVLLSVALLGIEAFAFFTRNAWSWGILALPIFGGLMVWLLFNDLRLIGVQASGGIVTLMNGVSASYGKMIVDKFASAKSQRM